MHDGCLCKPNFSLLPSLLLSRFQGSHAFRTRSSKTARSRGLPSVQLSHPTMTLHQHLALNAHDTTNLDSHNSITEPIARQITAFLLRSRRQVLSPSPFESFIAPYPLLSHELLNPFDSDPLVILPQISAALSANSYAAGGEPMISSTLQPAPPSLAVKAPLVTTQS